MKYFSLTELTKSETARAKGITNSPTLAETKNLNALVDKVLDPLRAAYGSPINVTSCYRCKKLNKAVGGASNSQHTKGMAADLVPKDGNVSRLFDLARRLGGFDQLIDEYSGVRHWVHISYDPTKAKQRGEVLLYKNGKYTRL